MEETKSGVHLNPPPGPSIMDGHQFRHGIELKGKKEVKEMEFLIKGMIYVLLCLLLVALVGLTGSAVLVLITIIVEILGGIYILIST